MVHGLYHQEDEERRGWGKKEVNLDQTSAIVTWSVLSWPMTFTRMPPSNMGWQSIDVTECAIVWRIRRQKQIALNEILF